MNACGQRRALKRSHYSYHGTGFMRVHSLRYPIAHKYLKTGTCTSTAGPRQVHGHTVSPVPPHMKRAELRRPLAIHTPPSEPAFLRSALRGCPPRRAPPPVPAPPGRRAAPEGSHTARGQRRTVPRPADPAAPPGPRPCAPPRSPGAWCR